MTQKYPVTGEAIRVLGVLIDEHLSTYDKYTPESIHIFNEKLSNLTLQLHGIIPFEKIEVGELPPIIDSVQENKWLAYYWTHVSNKRAAKVILYNSLRLVHNPNGKQGLHSEHKDWIRFSIYSVTQQDAYAVFNAHKNIFIALEFSHITIRGNRMESDTRNITKKKGIQNTHWKDENDEEIPELTGLKIEEYINDLSEV